MPNPLKVYKSSKIDPEKAKTLDRNKIGVLLTGPPSQKEIQRFVIVAKYVECPSCRLVGLIDSRFKQYCCSRCGAFASVESKIGFRKK